MASQGYRDWLKAGRPYKLIRPARALVVVLQGYGLTVYHYPNDAHLQANVPEDHTPFSVTGWPGTNARWNARGVDVMPRSDAYASRKENADIARQLIRDRDAGVEGVMWIKYLNWTTEAGQCSQERWTTEGQPLKRTTRGSTDRGHIHISGRSDADDDPDADGYDPIARMHGSAAAGGDDMSAAAEAAIERIDGRLAAMYYGMPGNPYGDGPMNGEPNQVGLALARLEAAAAADVTRDTTMQAALTAIAKAIEATGGSVEIAPVIAAVREAAEQSRQAVEQLHAELAAARAENGDLRERLATAFGPGSE